MKTKKNIQNSPAVAAVSTESEPLLGNMRLISALPLIKLMNTFIVKHIFYKTFIHSI